MGSSVIMAANSAGLQILPKSFGPEYEAGNTVKVCGNEIKIHGPSERDSVLASLYDEYPNMIVVDYTLPTLVNGKILGAYDTWNRRNLNYFAKGNLLGSSTLQNS